MDLPILIDGVIYHGEHYKYAAGDPLGKCTTDLQILDLESFGAGTTSLDLKI
jgi:hypothetical protein